MPGPCINDTATIDLVVSGSPAILSGNVKLSADADNAIVAHADGLWAQAPEYIDFTTAMPAAPYDGQLVYKSAGPLVTPRIWAFRYRSASIATEGYKWEFMGGAPLFGNLQSTVSVAPTAGVTLFTLAASTLDASLGNGLYEVSIEGEAEIGAPSVPGTWAWEMWLRMNAELEPPPQIRIAHMDIGPGAPDGRMHFANSCLLLIPPAASLSLRAHNYDTVNARNFYRSSCTITPIRISG